jgi:hypothetical protein
LLPRGNQHQQRRPDFLRTSITTKKPAQATKLQKPLEQTAEIVVDELKMAALTLEKIANRSVKRRKSADLKEIKQKSVSFKDQVKSRMEGMKVEPLFDPVSGTRIFHIASLTTSEILTRNTLADQAWFT